MTEPICEVIITADDEDWLINFTRSLLEDRFAACGQHIVPIRSIYRWNGGIHDGREARVALHTRASLVPAIVDRARREHSGRNGQSRLPDLGHRRDYRASWS
jgi:periplasmic divalent cation tolerance protein